MLRFRQMDATSSIPLATEKKRVFACADRHPERYRDPAPGPEFHGLTFSPDGIKVYFVRSFPNDPYFKYLYSIPVLGGSARQMIADVDTPVSFSPDGSQFAFTRAVTSRNVLELRIANADGSGERVLSSIRNADAGFFLFGPSWSPDGRSIVSPFRTLDQEVRWSLVSASVPEGAR